MSQALIDLLKKSRQFNIQCGDYTFIATRPTDMDMLMDSKGINELDYLTKYIVGWQGVKESDIVRSGSPELAEFSSEIFRLFIADRSEFWAAIVKEIKSAYSNAKQTQNETAKN